MTCDCFERVNEHLAEHNACLACNLLAPLPVAFVLTEKVDPKKRGKPPLLQAAFCPFCGKSYGPAKSIFDPPGKARNRRAPAVEGQS